VESTLRGLSLEDKIGQMLQVRYYADRKDLEGKEYIHLREELHKYHIGSVVFGMHFNQAGPVRSAPLEAARVSNQLQSDSKLPLLLAADLERGVASRLEDVPAFPWPMAFGAVGDANEVEHFAAVTAREARAIGVQWALAPVADVNSNPSNPIINDRSFGEDPGRVADYVAAFIHGAHQNGLLVTAKHFPGHGESSVDSHHGIPSIDGDLAHLEKFELPPFRKAVEVGVDAILLAHARVPAIEPNPDKITTISSRVVSETLKGRLGFRGVILTDALEMRGLTKLYDPQKGSPTARAAVDAVKAGCDVIMIPTDLDGAFHAIIEAVQKGEIAETRIDESVRKILEMKASVDLHKSRLVDLSQVLALTSERDDMEFAQHVAEEAVTLVRETGRFLPLKRVEESPSSTAPPEGTPQTKSRLIVVLLGHILEGTNGKEFEKAIMARRPDAHVFYVDDRVAEAGRIQVIQAVKEAEQVVVAAYVVREGVRKQVTSGETSTTPGFEGRPGKLLQRILAIAPDKTAVVALGSPYLIESFPQTETYVCTYAMATSSEISAVKALFGEIRNHAKLPVSLPGIAPRGFSLPWPTQLPRPVSAQAAQ
jgi:beta-N-acetylhexosaminidase